jgi:hypothetical protein
MPLAQQLSDEKFSRFLNKQWTLLRSRSLPPLLAVAIAAFVLPGKTLKVGEVGMIALVATATFAILDIYAPSVGAGARQGAGFGIGANLVGFPRV